MYPHKDYEQIMRRLEAECRTHIRVEQQMKIHIETLLQRLEESERRHRAELSANDARLQELQRDKTRLEELLALRAAEIDRALADQRHMAQAKELDRALIARQGERISQLERHIEEAKRKESAASETLKTVHKKMFNNSNSPTEN